MGPQQLLAKLCEALGIATEGRRIVGLTLEVSLTGAPRVQVEELVMDGGEAVRELEEWEIKPKRIKGP